MQTELPTNAQLPTFAMMCSNSQPPVITDAQMARELAIEEEMVSLGYARYHKALQAAKEAGEESSTTPGLTLLRHAIEPTSQAIVEYVNTKNEARATTGVRVPNAVKLLEQVNPDVAAYLTARAILDGVSRETLVTTLAVRIGGLIEDECRFRSFCESEIVGTDGKVHKGQNLFYKVRDDLNRRTRSSKHKRKVLIHSLNKAGQQWEVWSEAHKVQLGVVLIDLFRQATDLIALVRNTRAANDTPEYIVATEATTAWILEKNNRCELLAPEFLPTVVPPKPWTSPTGGGYYSPQVKPLTLVKTSNQNYLEELRHVEMSMVYKGINTIQNTPYRINRPLYDAMRAITSYDSGTCGIHVHLSRNQFTGCLHLYKFQRLFYENAAFVKTISQRKGDSLRQWAACDANTAEMVRKAKGEENYRRYSNLQTRREDYHRQDTPRMLE